MSCVHIKEGLFLAQAILLLKINLHINIRIMTAEMPDHHPSFIMKFLSHFTYPQKFVFISILFSLSLIAALSYMVEAQNQSVEMITLELKGIEYQSHLRKINENLLKHKSLAKRYLTGDASLKNELIATQREINTDLRSLISYDKENEGELE